MDTLNSLLGQLRELWARTPTTGRVVSSAAIAMMVATIAGVAVWSSRPDYKLLRDGISPVLTAEIVSVLNANSIPNKMNYSGSGVLVPTSRWNEANIAISDLGIPGTSTPSSPTAGLLPGATSHQDNVAARESALERSIVSLRAIKSAEVHLAMPEPSPFRDARQPATASVIVEPAPGQMISRELQMNIVHMVASAVEGLDPKNVTLTDSTGALGGSIINDDPASRQRELIRELEASLVMKAQALLESSLGPGKAVVRVTAEIDSYIDKVITDNKILIDSKARIEERLEETDQKGMPLASAGAAGTSSNGGGADAATGAQGMSGKTSTTETTYDYPTITEVTQMVAAQPTRLSVSAVVNVTPDDDGSGTAQGPLLTQEDVEGLIQTAVGFDATRGDQIQVVLTEFTQPAITPIAAPVGESQKWEFVGELAKNASLALAAVVALLIGMMTLKKLKPIEINATADDRRQRELLSELSARVDQNPEAVSKILGAWLGNQAESDEGDAPMAKAA